MLAGISLDSWSNGPTLSNIDPRRWLQTDAETGETFVDLYWIDACDIPGSSNVSWRNRTWKGVKEGGTGGYGQDDLQG